MRKRKPLKDRGCTYLYNKYYNRSEVFSLTYDEFSTLITSTCHYCGVEPSNVLKVPYGGGDYEVFTYNGIDRVDNLLGYIVGNVVSCCHKCNWAKKDMTTEEFYIWVKRVYDTIIHRYRG